MRIRYKSPKGPGVDEKGDEDHLRNDVHMIV